MDKSPNWDTSWADIDFERQTSLTTGLFSNFLDIVVPRVAQNTKRALEIGCFPGKFIDYVGQKGYTISGIDTYPRVGRIAEWASARGRDVGLFTQTTLEEYAKTSNEKFDIVLSLGFIEHFNHFCGVIFDHATLCKTGGTVIIGAPNFASPIQRALHRVLDKDNLSNHVLETMYPKVWAIFLRFLGFRVDYAGAIGGFDFWHETSSTNEQITILQNLMPHLSPFVQKLGEQFNNSESSYLAVVGTKGDMLPSREDALDFADFCHSIAADLSIRDEALSDAGVSFLERICR